MSADPKEVPEISARDRDGRFQKGVSGNPGGRRAGPGLKAAIEQELRTQGSAGFATKADQMAFILVEMGLHGDIRAIAEILKRVWPAPLAVSFEHEATIQIVRNYSSNRKPVRIQSGKPNQPEPIQPLGHEEIPFEMPDMDA